mgnify:FL=1
MEVLEKQWKPQKIGSFHRFEFKTKIITWSLLVSIVLSSCCDDCADYPSVHILQIDTSLQSGFSSSEIENLVLVTHRTNAAKDTQPLYMNPSKTSLSYGAIGAWQLNLNENSTNSHYEVVWDDSVIALLEEPLFINTTGKGICSCDETELSSVHLNGVLKSTNELPVLIYKK